MVSAEIKSGITKIVLQNSNEGLNLFVGHEVLTTLAKPEFQRSWDELYNQCSWATIFQSHAFVVPWFNIYQQQYLPILIAWESKGKLRGLLALAKNKNGLIVGAGDADAEYHVWLAAEQDGEWFIKTALCQLQKRFPGSKVQFKYLPAGVTLKGTGEKAWTRQCLLQQIKLPLVLISDETLSNELKKKSNKYKINRLKRQGTLSFERITDLKAFNEVFDEIALQYDFRRKALYNVRYFDKKEAREFFFAMFENGLLHVTVSKLDEKIIAAAIATVGRGTCVHCKGLNTYSFFHARSSPGILHLLMMGRLLAEEGTDVLDFSPGSDFYKECLANKYGHVYVLIIGNTCKLLLRRARLLSVSYLRKIAAGFGVRHGRLKKAKWRFLLFKDTVLHKVEKGLLLRGKNPLWGQSLFLKKRQYNVNGYVPAALSSIHLQKNSLSDLMQFSVTGARPTCWEFLADAMLRFETGEHSFSCIENGKLVFCCWLAGIRSSSEADKENPTKTNLFLLHQFYCHPEGRGKLTEFLKAAIAAVTNLSNVHQLYVQAENNAVCRALEAMGIKLGKPVNA